MVEAVSAFVAQLDVPINDPLKLPVTLTTLIAVGSIELLRVPVVILVALTKEAVWAKLADVAEEADRIAIELIEFPSLLNNRSAIPFILRVAPKVVE